MAGMFCLPPRERSLLLYGIFVLLLIIGNKVDSRMIAGGTNSTTTGEINKKEPWHYGDENNPAKSCEEIFEKDPNLPSGVYWLEFLRIGSDKTFKEKHYCENEKKKNLNKIMVARPMANQMSPTQPIRGSVSSSNAKDTESLTAVDNLTAGHPDREPQEDEYLNEQQQWPLPITPPSKEEMRKRLEKAAQSLQDNNNKNIVQNANNQLSEVYAGQATVEAGNSKIREKQRERLSDTGQISNVVSERVFTDKSQDIDGRNVLQRSDTLERTQSNVSKSLLSSTEGAVQLDKQPNGTTSSNDHIVGSTMAELPFQQTISKSTNSSKPNVRMTLLNWRKISLQEIAKKTNLASTILHGSATENEMEKKLNKKEQEREGLFVKPGLNRGVIETMVQKNQKNATKINKLTENVNARDIVSSRSNQNSNEFPTSTEQLYKLPKNAVFKNGFGTRFPVLIGGELSIEGNPTGDPIKKPNPDEIHSGLWTSEVQRMMDKLHGDLSKHKEHAEDHNKQLFKNLVNKDIKMNKPLNDPNNLKQSRANKPSIKPRYKPSIKPRVNNTSSNSNDLLFFVSPKIKEEAETASSHPGIKDVSSKSISSSTPEVKVTIGITKMPNSNPISKSEKPSQTQLRIDMEPVSAVEIKDTSNQSIEKSKGRHLTVLVNGLENLNNASKATHQSEDKSIVETDTQQRSSPQVYAQANVSATAFAHTNSHSHSSSLGQKPKKKKTSSQLAMEKTKASLAERIKQFNADLKADTESNYFHWAKQPPEKTPMQLRLEKITQKLKGKQSTGVVSNTGGKEGTDDVGTSDINSIDWTSFDEKHTPSMLEINKRLNAIPYARLNIT